MGIRDILAGNQRMGEKVVRMPEFRFTDCDGCGTVHVRLKIGPGKYVGCSRCGATEFTDFKYKGGATCVYACRPCKRQLYIRAHSPEEMKGVLDTLAHLRQRGGVVDGGMDKRPAVRR